MYQKIKKFFKRLLGILFCMTIIVGFPIVLLFIFINNQYYSGFKADLKEMINYCFVDCLLNGEI